VGGVVDFKIRLRHNGTMAQQEFTSPFPSIPADHPAYSHSLICEAAMKGIPFMILVSESIPRTINLMSWAMLETDGGMIPDPDDPAKFKGQYDPGTGHDCLALTTPNGIEIELTEKETTELIYKLEIMLGKKLPAIIVPGLGTPKLRKIDF